MMSRPTKKSQESIPKKLHKVCHLEVVIMALESPPKKKLKIGPMKPVPLATCTKKLQATVPKNLQEVSHFGSKWLKVSEF